MTPTAPPGVSFVIPVHNGAPWLDGVLDAIRAQTYTGPVEVIVVDDRSTDDSIKIARRRDDAEGIVILNGPGRGATAAMNLGITAAAHPLIAQIDQDVVISPGWLSTLVAAIDDDRVAAAQGHYVAAGDAGPWSRVMGLDLAQRYQQLGPWTNHVCTGNSVYRKSALLEIGLFDETLGYGYDNDVSYRLVHAGYRLAFRAQATSTHYWREGLMNYARQQYGFGYGRLDLISKHRRRLGGDNVSRLAMMLHGPLMAIALAALVIAAGLAIAGRDARTPAVVGLALVAGLAVERAIAGARAASAFNDRAGLWFAPAHLVRDVAWATAIGIWLLRRLRGQAPDPTDSMPTGPRRGDLSPRGGA
jgi:hypothetical protein